MVGGHRMIDVIPGARTDSWPQLAHGGIYPNTYPNKWVPARPAGFRYVSPSR
jgi:hypothetical protein